MDLFWVSSYWPDLFNNFLEWQQCRSYAETLFFTKKSYHRNVSLALYFQIFYFSFCQKTNLHLHKRSRLSSLLFTFFWRFSIRRSCHSMFQFLKLHQMIRHKLIRHFCTIKLKIEQQQRATSNFWCPTLKIDSGGPMVQSG